jgi:hypothetical protein
MDLLSTMIISQCNVPIVLQTVNLVKMAKAVIYAKMDTSLLFLTELHRFVHKIAVLFNLVPMQILKIEHANHAAKTV